MEIFRRISLNQVLVGAGIFVAGVALSLALCAIVLVRMPAEYFRGEAPKSLLAGRPAWQQKLGHVGKNLLGVLLIVLGVLLSLPGVPGQGVLTILIGLTLVDFPGKRRLEKRIMKNPTVLNGANRIRARFGKPPFELDKEELSSKASQ